MRSRTPTPGRRLSRLGTLTDLILLTVATLLIGRYAQAFTGFPKGYDAWGHLSKARMLQNSFPNINWNDQWYAGQPAFLGSYPPGYHALLAATSWATGWSLPHSMVVLAAVAVVATVAGCYLLVAGVTGARTAGLLASALLLACPTLWDQVVELGLYPRFTAFAFGTLAAGFAGLRRRRPTRIRTAATVAALAAALGTHPVSGGISCGAVALILLCATDPTLGRRIWHAAAVCGSAVAACGTFYVPLLLLPRAQSALTDFEIPLRWTALLFADRTDIGTLAPVLLAGTLVVAVAVTVPLIRPGRLVRRLGRTRGIPVAAVDPDTAAGDDERSPVATYLAWRDRLHGDGPDALIAAGLTAAAALALAYGLIGHAVAHFAFYVNGLQPRDLLVYVAWLLSAALGVGAHLALRHHRRRAQAVAAVTAGVLIAACLIQAVPLLPLQVRDGSGPAADAMIGLLPAESRDNTTYRIAGLADGTSRWINAVTSTPQVRGYDDHGNLHLDWQYWLEHTLNDPTHSTPAQREFLLDYYAVKWVLTDTPAEAAALRTDPAFGLTGSEQVYADVSAWTYRDARPITTAVTAPTVYVIGDDTHYDLLLRALALAGVGAERLLPVHGPASLNDVTADQLRGHGAVLVYGATTTPTGAQPHVLTDYAKAGGHVVVDIADNPAADSVARAAGAPVTRTRLGHVADQWSFTGVDADQTTGWGPPAYGGGYPWDVRTLTRATSGQVLLATAGAPAVVRSGVGAGTVTWSGLNLPYHANVYANADEANYVATLLGAVATPTPVTHLAATHPDPQHRTVTLPAGTNQVLVREYTTGDWHATVDGQTVPVLAAGPDMTLVRVPNHPGRAVTVELTYRLNLVEQTGNVLSALGLVGLVAYACGAGVLLRRRRRTRPSWRRAQPLTFDRVRECAPPRPRHGDRRQKPAPP